VSLFRGDASEIYELAGNLSAVGPKMVPTLRSTMGEVGDAFAEEWANNAREHFHEDGHAGRYPKSIDADLVFGVSSVAVEAGPNPTKAAGGRSQAFLGPVLEFGNEDTPAYLDGLRALDGMQQRTERVIDSMMGYLLP